MRPYFQLKHLQSSIDSMDFFEGWVTISRCFCVPVEVGRNVQNGLQEDPQPAGCHACLQGLRGGKLRYCCTWRSAAPVHTRARHGKNTSVHPSRSYCMYLYPGIITVQDATRQRLGRHTHVQLAYQHIRVLWRLLSQYWKRSCDVSRGSQNTAPGCLNCWANFKENNSYLIGDEK